MTWTNLEVVDGVGRGKPGGSGVLLGAEGPVEGLADGTQVEGTHGRCCNTVAIYIERYMVEKDSRERERGEKYKDIISTIIFMTACMLAPNESISAASSCVIKPLCNVFHPLNGSPIILYLH